MSREIKLSKYLPKYVAEYSEIKEIGNCSEVELKNIVEETEKVKNNMFIVSCDEVGVLKYEKMIGIEVDKNNSVGLRKNKVMVKWQDTIPYTYKILEQKVNTLLGSGNCKIVYENESYTIIIHTKTKYETLVELVKMCNELLPANLVLTVRNVAQWNSDSRISVGLVVRKRRTYKIYEKN